MNTIKLIIKFIEAAVAVLNKAIAKELASAAKADQRAADLRSEALLIQLSAVEHRKQAKQATALAGKLNQLIEG